MKYYLPYFNTFFSQSQRGSDWSVINQVVMVWRFGLPFFGNPVGLEKHDTENTENTQRCTEFFCGVMEACLLERGCC